MKSTCLIGMICLMIGLAGCAAEPFKFKPDNELKPGPGVFSGEEGEFTIFRIPAEENHKGNGSAKVQKGETK